MGGNTEGCLIAATPQLARANISKLIEIVERKFAKWGIFMK